MTLKSSLEVIQGYRKNDTIRSGTCIFVLTFHSNHGPISYRSEKRRFKSKIAKLHVYFVALLKGFLCNWVPA